MKIANKQVLALSVGFIISTSNYAQETAVQLEAHQHGVVELNIALDDQQLMLELTAPGNDIVGFEHSPETEAEKAVLNRSLQILNNPQALFSFNKSADCKLQGLSISESFSKLESDEHDEHDEAHKKEHEHEEHDHEDEHSQDEGQHHGGVRAQYHYSCKNADQLKQVMTRWFEVFERSEAIKVQLLLGDSQKSVSLDKDNSRIDF